MVSERGTRQQQNKSTDMIKAIGAIFLLLTLATHASGQQYTISGHVRDSSSGEALIGANIHLKKTNKGTSTNAYGFYSLTVGAGPQTLVYTYMGYAS